MNEVYKTLTLLGTQEVQIKVARGIDISRAAYMHALQGKPMGFDIAPFIMVELCLVNAERMNVEFYLNLLIDDYLKISVALEELLKPLQ